MEFLHLDEFLKQGDRTKSVYISAASGEEMFLRSFYSDEMNAIKILDDNSLEGIRSNNN